MDTRARADQIRSEVERALAGTGIDVEGVHVHQAGRRSQLRVTVARDVSERLTGDTTSRVAPLTLDEVAAATRVVDEVVEGGDLMGQAAFTLEVSSPGVDQPLTTPAQLRRNVGRLVELVLTDGRTLAGRVAEAGVDGVRLADEGRTTVRLEELTTATVQVEFTRNDAEEDI